MRSAPMSSSRLGWQSPMAARPRREGSKRALVQGLGFSGGTGLTMWPASSFDRPHHLEGHQRSRDGDI